MVNPNVRPVEEYELNTWDAFVQSCEAGQLYHTSTWQKVINNAYGSGRYTIAAAASPTGITGGFVALTRSRLGVKTAVTPLLTPYTGYLLPSVTDENKPGLNPDDNQSTTLQQLRRFARQYRYQSLQCAPSIPALIALSQYGYQVTPRLTLEINLTLPEDELWRNMRSHVQRNIRKAQRAEYEISDRWDPEQAYDLFRQTFERHRQRCEVSHQYFDEIATGATLQDNRNRFCAWQEDRLLGYVVALHYKRTVYYQLAAAGDEGRTAGVPSQLLWDMLRAYQALGYEQFDFLGANTPGITKFKEAFGATPVPHSLVSLCKSRRLLISRGLRQLLTKR